MKIFIENKKEREENKHFFLYDAKMACSKFGSFQNKAKKKLRKKTLV